jgi:hypothetical protein
MEQLALFTEDPELAGLHKERHELKRRVDALEFKIRFLIAQGKPTPASLCNEYGETAQRLKDCQRDIERLGNE